MEELILTGLFQGLILALVAFGVMIPFRLLDFPDLTAEGTYPLGGAICASLLMMDVHPLLAVLCAAVCAGMAGMATALIHLRLQVNTLLAGIILSTMIYSVNLRIMGRPNIGLFDQHLLLNGYGIAELFLLLLNLALMVLPLGLFLRTEVGLSFRAVGLNPSFAKRQGISVPAYILLGLFLAHAYVGVAGALMVQMQSYMDVGMGVGIVIHALAALIIGENIIGTHTLNRQLLAPLIGALVYQQIQGLALAFGLAPSDLKLLTGVIILTVIAMGKASQKRTI
jgi:putative ABC transport system permease protein